MTTTGAQPPATWLDVQRVADSIGETRIDLGALRRTIEQDVRGDLKEAAELAVARQDKIMTQLNTITLVLLGSNVAFLFLLIFLGVLLILQMTGAV